MKEAAAGVEQLTVLRAVTWGFHCPALILLAPLSFLRALLLSYLAFPSLSPHNPFSLLSPTVTPFLIIVSIRLFILSICGGLGALSVLGSPCQPHSRGCARCALWGWHCVSALQEHPQAIKVQSGTESGPTCKQGAATWHEAFGSTSG